MLDRRHVDLLGLAELDSTLAADSALPEPEPTPADRAQRLAARRAFVEMKQLFQRSVAGLEHRKAAWLRTQVRAAEEPSDLWRLRGPLLAVLRQNDSATRHLRAELYRSLDSVFPEAFGVPDLAPVPPAAEAWMVWSGDVRAAAAR